MPAAIGGNSEFFRSVKQVFPVLSPEPEMTKDLVEVRGAPSRRIFQFWTTVLLRPATILVGVRKSTWN
jgi:hypothetical protein